MKLKNFLTIAVLSFVVGFAGISAVTTSFASQNHNDHKVTICHATGSNNNPYNKITVDDDAVDGQGNSDHNRSGHQNGEDIIPPGYWDFNGRNWTTEGQAIYRNDCNKPVIVVTPTVAPTIPVPTIPNPTEEPTVTPTATPSATPEPDQLKTEQPGPAASLPGSTTEAPRCEETAPTKTGANFHVYRKGGDVIAKWFPTEGNKANIYYKQVNSPEWQYALTDVDNDGYVEIHELGSLDITFALQQANNCAGGPLTNPVVDGNTNGWVLFR